MNGVHWQTSLAVALGDVIRQRRAHGTIRVDNIALNARGQPLIKRQLGFGDQLVVEADIEAMVLLADVESGDARAELVSRSEDEGQVDVGGLVGPQIIANL